MEIKVTLTSEQLENLVREITEKVVEELTPASVAEELDVCAIADYVEIDNRELAEHIDVEEVAEHIAAHIDMSELASVLRNDEHTSEFLNEQIQKAFYERIRPVKLTVEEVIRLMQCLMTLTCNPFDNNPEPVTMAPVSLETAEEVAGIVQILKFKAEIQDFGVVSKQVKISKP